MIAYAAVISENPAISYEESIENPLLVRKIIYKHYFNNLNLMGHAQSDQGFQLTIYIWTGHAHNIYLQYATDFGIIMIGCFFVLNLLAAVKMMKNYFRTGNVGVIMSFLIMLVPLSFGLLEYSWGSGSVSIALLFIVWQQAILEKII